jgi:hypothetical protein
MIRRRRRLFSGDGWRGFVAPAVETTMTLASLGIGGAGRCTIFGEATITTVGSGAEQVVVQVDDGTNANRFYTRNPGVGGSFTIIRALASATATNTPGSLTSGVAFRFALAINGDGSIRGSLNGSAVGTVVGGPSSGLTTLRIGCSATGSVMGGSFALIRVKPNDALANAALIALST